MAKIITLTGLCCAGKSSIETMLKNTGFCSVRSTTTRAPRASETSESYQFVEKITFERMIADQALVEYSMTGKDYYGVSKQELALALEKSKNLVLVVDLHGAKAIKAYGQRTGIEVVNIYVKRSPMRCFITLFERILTKEISLIRGIKRLKYFVAVELRQDKQGYDRVIKNESSLSVLEQNIRVGLDAL